MANQWFKFYGAEFLSDPKIGRLSSAERSCWLTILCMASQTNGVIEYLTVEDLLSKSGIKWNPYDEGDWERCQGILLKFDQLKMIKVSQDESSIEVLNWEKRQETALTVAERQAKYRQNKKSNEKVTERVTKVTLEENRIEENVSESEDAPQVVEVFEGEEKPARLENRKKDKETIYHLFSKTEQPWWRHKQQKVAALSLFDLVGVEKVTKMLRYSKEHSDDPYCPQPATPFEFEEKMPKLIAYAKRNS